MTVRIGVVGAGASGLMTALELRSSGHEVTVFESRDRVGGRIHTVRFPDGRWANAGAEWLNSTDAIAHELVTRYQLPLAERYGFEAVVVDGKPLGESATSLLHRKLAAEAASLTNLLSPWDDERALALDRMSVAEWAYRQEAKACELDEFFADMEGEFMAPVTKLSMAGVALSSASTSDDRSTRIATGTASLPEAMADELGSDSIRLAEPVLSITHSDGEVRLRTPAGDYEFDAVVLTVPLAVLGQIQIEPSLKLPWIGQGRGGKVLVPYENREWSIQASMPRLRDAPMEFIYESASHQNSEGGILAAYATGVIEESRVLSAFESWFPGLRRSSAGPVSKWWHLDPHSGTTYSAPQPGYLRSLRDIRVPRNRIFLAGEHTEVLFGYVESALLSGRRVAGQVLASGL